MRVLHILRKEPTETVREIIETHRRDGHEVAVVELFREDLAMAEVLTEIEATDRMMTW